MWFWVVCQAQVGIEGANQAMNKLLSTPYLPGYLCMLPLHGEKSVGLSVQEFRDCFTLHYKKPLLCLPSALVDVEHHSVLNISLTVWLIKSTMSSMMPLLMI